MNKIEKEKIKQVIRMIHHDNKYYSALNILAKMVGWETYIPETEKTKRVMEILREGVLKGVQDE